MQLEEKFKADFAHNLLKWYMLNKRPLPWRASDDPYKIWVSEIMLQQTQVDTVISYYHRFLKMFPDVASLATASLTEVLKMWEGLGYYARARNLHSAARILVKHHGGKLPSTHTELLQVPGIGPYTAAAIASIAFDENHPVLDGNVVRVLSRLFLIEEHPAQKNIKSTLRSVAKQLLLPGRAGDFNQAMMELGATVCTPNHPKCNLCPVRSFCKALQNLVDPSVLPVKKVAKEKPHYDIAVGIIWKNGRILIDQRPADGLLGGLWEFPGGKLEPGETLAECVAREIREELGVQVRVREPFMSVRHAYSHFKITLHSFQCDYLAGKPLSPKGMSVKWLRPKELQKYPFPRANQKILHALLTGYEQNSNNSTKRKNK